MKFLFSSTLLSLGASLCVAAQAPAPANQAPAAQKPRSPAAQMAQFAGAGGRNYSNIDPAAVERGHQIFSTTCAFCHGANAKGGETGPDLLRSVIVLDDDHGEKIGEVVHNGRPDKGMPKFNLSDQQISDIAAFLHDRIRAAALRGTYQIQNILVGDPKAGEAYFNGAGHCNTCHSVTGDLAHIGNTDPVALQQKILMPRAERGFGRRRQATAEPKAPITAKVTLPSGAVIEGKLEHIDDFVVCLTDSEGNYRSFARNGDVPKVEVRDPLQAHLDLLTKYTDADIHNLTAYLATLK